MGLEAQVHIHRFVGAAADKRQILQAHADIFHKIPVEKIHMEHIRTGTVQLPDLLHFMERDVIGGNTRLEVILHRIAMPRYRMFGRNITISGT